MKPSESRFGVKHNIADVGPFTQYVREVADFAASGLVFTGPCQAEYGYRLLDTEEEAAEYSTYHVTEGYGTWTNLCEHNIARVLESARGNAALRPYLTHIEDLMFQIVGLLSIQKGVRSELLHVNLEADFGLIARARALVGPSDRFFESLFMVYRRGLLPVGWFDAFPSGNYVVYMNEDSQSGCT